MTSTLKSLLVVALAAPAVALAQAFPSKPIKIIVPFGAGSGTDLLARVVGERLSETLGQPVVAENREGAGGMVGAQATQKSPADGYTIMMAANPFVVAPHLQAKLPYDVIRDFAPVAKLGVLPMALVTSSASPYRSVTELVAFAKANPGKLNYANSGKGSPSHLETEMIKQTLGLQIQDIPYKSVGQAMTDTLAGVVGIYFPVVPAALGHHNAGKLRILGIGSRKRISQAPEVPTLAEALGKPGYEANVWYGFVAPAGTPQDAIAKLQDAILKALAHPVARERIEKSGTEIEAGSAADFGALLKRENDKWGQLVTSLGLKATN